MVATLESTTHKSAGGLASMSAKQVNPRSFGNAAHLRSAVLAKSSESTDFSLRNDSPVKTSLTASHFRSQRPFVLITFVIEGGNTTKVIEDTHTFTHKDAGLE